jgi:hypothetical protein
LLSSQLLHATDNIKLKLLSAGHNIEILRAFGLRSYGWGVGNEIDAMLCSFCLSLLSVFFAHRTQANVDGDVLNKKKMQLSFARWFLSLAKPLCS